MRTSGAYVDFSRPSRCPGGNSRLLARVLLALLVAIGASAVAYGKWICVENENFRVFGNVRRNQATELLVRLEQFHRIVGRLHGSVRPLSVPIDVFLFKDKKSFEPYLPVFGGETAQVAGYFTASRPKSLIALRLGWDSEQTARIIFHEFTHFLTREANWPLWLTEGVAEFYSTFRCHDTRVTLGLPIEEHIRYLRERPLIPLNQFIAMDQSAVGYSDTHRTESYYSEAWILFHFLRMVDDSDIQNRLLSYVARLSAGLDPVSSFHLVFDPVPVEEELRNYIHRNTFPIMKITLRNSELESDVSYREVTEAEVLARSAELLFRKNQVERSQATVVQAEREHAPAGVVAMMKGLLAYYQGHWDEASKSFRKAVVADPDYFLAHFFCGISISNALSSEGRFDREQAGTITGHLARSVELRPSFLEGYEHLADFQLHTEIDLDQGIDAAAHGLELDPADHRLTLTLAELQIKKNDETAARSALTRLKGSGVEPEIRQQADVLLNALDAAHAADSGADGVPSLIRKSLGDRGIPDIVRDEPIGQGTDWEQSTTPGCRPDFTSIGGTHSITGVLEEIRCKNGMATYVVTSAGGDTWLLDAPLDTPVLFSCSVKLENLNCGPFHMLVVAYYSGSGENAPRHSRAVAIEVKAAD